MRESTYRGCIIFPYDDGCPGTRYAWTNEETGQESYEAFDTIREAKADIDKEQGE